MSRYLRGNRETAKRTTKSQADKPGKNLDSRMKRIAQEQTVHDVTFEMEASSVTRDFEQTISAVYGVPGIGKSRFGYCLGEALKQKHGLATSGAYFIQCEPINHPWKIRKSQITTWPTFRKFVDDAEKDAAFVSTVKMWVLDTIDAVVPKGISTICHDFGISDLREGTRKVGTDGWHAEAWQELKAELLHQVLRLANLGPGVLILSHERSRSTRIGNMEADRASMDISNSVYNAIGDACSMILRIRHRDDADEQDRPPRCLSAIASENEECKDNLGVVLPRYSKGVIPFDTEEDAVEKLLECFSGVKVKKHKKFKKAKRR